jgi:hypothetical protein
VIPNVHAMLNVSAVNAFVAGRIYRTVAPQDAARPYIVWQTVSAAPGNNLSCDPEFDNFRIQIICWSADQAQCRNLQAAAQTAAEAVTHVVFGPLDGFDKTTAMHSLIFDIETWDER